MELNTLEQIIEEKIGALPLTDGAVKEVIAVVALRHGMRVSEQTVRETHALLQVKVEPRPFKEVWQPPVPKYQPGQKFKLPLSLYPEYGGQEVEIASEGTSHSQTGPSIVYRVTVTEEDGHLDGILVHEDVIDEALK